MVWCGVVLDGVMRVRAVGGGTSFCGHVKRHDVFFVEPVADTDLEEVVVIDGSLFESLPAADADAVGDLLLAAAREHVAPATTQNHEHRRQPLNENLSLHRGVGCRCLLAPLADVNEVGDVDRAKHVRLQSHLAPCLLARHSGHAQEAHVVLTVIGVDVDIVRSQVRLALALG